LAEEKAECLAVLGEKRDAVANRVSRRTDIDLLAFDVHVALRCIRESAEQGGDQRRPARTHQAAKPENFAAIGRKRDIADLVFAGQGSMINSEVCHVQNLPAALARALRIHLRQLAADHPGDDLVERDVRNRNRLADGAAVAQHHDAIGDHFDLLHLVRDVAKADAGLAQAPDHPE
jgi:hypothetical protein